MSKGIFKTLCDLARDDGLPRALEQAQTWYGVLEELSEFGTEAERKGLRDAQSSTGSFLNMFAKDS